MLVDNPFSVLNVTPRSKRAEIMAAADDAMLDGNQEAVQRSRNILLNPRQRLVAEVGFLGSLSKTKAKKLLDLLRSEDLITDSTSLDGLPDLAVLNLGETLLDKEKTYKKAQLKIIQQMIVSEKNLTIAKLQREIDAERSAGGFPQIGDEQQLRQVWQEHLGTLRESVLRILGMAANPSKVLAGIIEETSEGSGAFLNGIVSAYEEHPDVQVSLIKLEELMTQTCEDICKQTANEADTAKYEEYLIQCLELWAEIYEPINLLSDAEGIANERKQTLLRNLREGLFDMHKYEEGAVKQKELYQRIVDTAGSDGRSGDQLIRDIDELETLAEEEEGPNVSIEFGQRTLEISRGILTFNQREIILKDVTHIRFGSYRHSVNFIPVERSHAIWLMHDGYETKIECQLTFEAWENGRKRFDKVIDALWQPVVVRLIMEAYLELKEDNNLKIGHLVLTKEGIALRQKSLFKVTTEIVPWQRINVSFAEGNVYLVDMANKGFRESLTFRDTYNAVLLDKLVTVWSKA